MEKKIYIVTSGNYSDYRIDSVFSTKEKAKEYVQNNGSDYHRIEVYNLDEPIVKRNKLWLISFNLEDGKIEDATVSNCKKEYYCDTCKYEPHSFVKHLNFYVEAEIIDKAKKIASERFVAVKANEYVLFRLTHPYASTYYDKKYERFNVKTNEFIKE